MRLREGVLYWITGLAGAGKTTLGKALKEKLESQGASAILLDGDALREVVGGAFGYTAEERLRCAQFYSRLCRLLTSQGQNVICCTISMFESVRSENRRVNPRYCEIYLKAGDSILKQRNQKNLYSGDNAKHVVGVDLKPELPQNADITFDLELEGTNLDAMVNAVLAGTNASSPETSI